MNKRIRIACLAAMAFVGQAKADAIPFFNMQYEATAVASASGGTPGFTTQSGVLGADAVTQSADSIGTTDIATAGSIVGLGLLSTSADVSAGGISNAVASARFIGSFVNGSGVNLSLDFTGVNVVAGSGNASTTLYVSLASNGVTLFSDYVQGAWQYAYTPVAGSTSLLDLTLTSDVSAAFLSAGAGNAGSFGLVNITGAVPEASTWLLFSLGLGGVVLVGGRVRRQAPHG